MCGGSGVRSLHLPHPGMGSDYANPPRRFEVRLCVCEVWGLTSPTPPRLTTCVATTVVWDGVREVGVSTHPSVSHSAWSWSASNVTYLVKSYPGVGRSCSELCP